MTEKQKTSFHARVCGEDHARAARSEDVAVSELKALGVDTRGILCIRGSCPRCRKTVNLIGHECGNA